MSARMIMKNDYSKRSMPLNWGVSKSLTTSRLRIPQLPPLAIEILRSEAMPPAKFRNTEAALHLAIDQCLPFGSTAISAPRHIRSPKKETSLSITVKINRWGSPDAYVITPSTSKANFISNVCLFFIIPKTNAN